MLSTYLSLGSRDHPSRGPAVALTPPLLNSISESSRLKEVEWLLFNLQEFQCHRVRDQSMIRPLVLMLKDHVSPAEESLQTSGLFFGFCCRRWSSISNTWFWRSSDDGQVQVIRGFMLRRSCGQITAEDYYGLWQQQSRRWRYCYCVCHQLISEKKNKQTFFEVFEERDEMICWSLTQTWRTARLLPSSTQPQKSSAKGAADFLRTKALLTGNVVSFVREWRTSCSVVGLSGENKQN